MMTFDEGRIRMGQDQGYVKLPYYQGGPDPELEKMPLKPDTPPSQAGFQFLQDFIGQERAPYGGSPGQEIPREVIEKMGQPGTEPPAGFFEELRRNLGSTGVKEARSPSFELFPPDIDSPEADKALKDFRERYGSSRVSPQDVFRRQELLRNRIRNLSI
jgi:hypothetical protein